MAALATMTMGELNEDRKAVHPFFQKGATPRELQDRTIDVQISIPPEVPVSQSSSETAKQPLDQTPNQEPKKAASSLQKQTQTNLELPERLGGNGQTDSLEVNPNNGRRKRRKTTSPEGKADAESTTEEVGKISQMLERPQTKRRVPISPNISLSAVSDTASLGVASKVNETSGRDVEGLTPTKARKYRLSKKTPEIIVIADGPESKSDSAPGRSRAIRGKSNNLESNPTRDTIAQIHDKPKKILKLNPKTGTIGSPPAKKAARLSDTNAQKKQPKSRLLTIRYGHGLPLSPTIGLQIEQILNSSKNVTHLPAKLIPSPLKAASNPPKLQKSIHPLFLGKAIPKPVSPQETTQDYSVIGLTGPTGSDVFKKVEPRSQVRPRSPSRPMATAFSGFGGSAKTLKFPGAVGPAWPWQGMVHIHGNDIATTILAAHEPNIKSPVRKGQKGKCSAVQIPHHENIIHSLAAELNVGELLKDMQEINLDDFPPLPPCLRLPIKHCETGLDIQRRIRKELSTRFMPLNVTESSSEDEIQTNEPTRSRIHPALTKMYNLIATSMSAFDQGRCETQAWVHKHSPKAASEVLQTGPEAFILKEWLQALTVQSVEAGLRDGSRSRASSLSRRSGASKSDVSGKRKRKSKKLDGFVISSDEESNDMDEISEPEDSSSPHGSQGLLKKTVIRMGDKGSKESRKLKNAVLISGRHGCGKTGAVYAVAKELGFEIFEINSSSRRSGKDIMEKVGDMTRNHLVQRHNPLFSEPVDEDNQRLEEVLANDIQSGRQGTMISFFKPKPSNKMKPKSNKSASATKKCEVTKDAPAIKAPPKQQKQSLILIEEVDILYEEDKQFWATVMSLIAQSKRPIIMTCNDESVVPTLPVHAIIRFNPPPTDLAVDYMLLSAACEGHILRREAVTALYESRWFDLRASLAELDFWCQFAVGDQKCGLDWFYRRYPVGSDKDNHKNQVRVISEDTYQTGMGWLSQDFLKSHIHHLDVEEETLHEAWDGWNLDAGDWQTQLRVDDWATSIWNPSSSSDAKLAALKTYEDFSDGLSVTDLCSGGAFAPDHKVDVDKSLPELSTKVRDDYILAFNLLEASPVVSYNILGKDISLWMKSRSRNYFHLDQHVKHNFEIPPEIRRPSEKDIIHLIRQQATTPKNSLTRQDFSSAFDPISEPEKTSLYNSGYLEPSCFDKSKSLIAEDIAPYIRSIVSYDTRLQQDRAKLSNLTSEGGRRGKRIRTTRAAISALEGGARSTTRRDRYFGPGLNPYFVLKTGKQSWLDAVAAGTKHVIEASGSQRSSAGGYTVAESAGED